MISEDKYSEIVKMFISNSYLKISDFDFDILSLSKGEQAFICAITKKTSQAQLIIDEINYDNLTHQEELLINDSKLLILVTEHPEYYKVKSPNSNLLKEKITSALEMYPNSVMSLYIFSIYAIYNRNDSEALSILQRLDQIFPSTDRINRLLAQVYFHLHKYKESIELINTLKPSMIKCVEKLALQYFAYGYLRVIVGVTLVLILIFTNPFWIPILFLLLVIFMILSFAFIKKSEILLVFGINQIFGYLICIIVSLIWRYLTLLG